MPKFVGTPDYLCPESILGIGSDDCAVDWWALGAVMYEFLYGFPPFHADTPEKVFDNIISRRINWYEDQLEISPEARDLMERLMCMDPKQRLGAKGAPEVKAHPWFDDIDWATVMTCEANFVPNVTDPESTDYFDARGAKPQVFADEAIAEGKALMKTSPTSATRQPADAQDSDRYVTDDFGAFTFKNLGELKQANDDVIRKLRTDQMTPTLTVGVPRDRRLSVVAKMASRPKGSLPDMIPPSPATSSSSSASTPSRGPGTPVTPGPHLRRPSDQNPLDRVKSLEYGEAPRRKSAPESARSASVSEEDQGEGTGRASITPETQASSDRVVDVLIAEDNPISQKILETLLTRMGCRCVSVNDGAEALAAAMADIRFDVIILDLMMPNITGDEVARMIRSTHNANLSTPIIAVTSYELQQANLGAGTLFSAILSKPLAKRDLVDCLAKLGFILGNPLQDSVDPLDRTKILSASARLQAM